jgi:hypothetical protein
MAPGGAQVPQTKLEQGADEFMRAGDGRIPGMGGQQFKPSQRLGD